jgi:outer membrane protein assembly factor BamB
MTRAFFAFALVGILAHGASAAPSDGSWPQFRGPLGNGHAAASGLPVTWSETQNVKWRTAIPGEGWSSPVVMGGRLWMQTALDGGRSLRAVCVDQTSGAVQHNVEVFYVEAPEEKHALNSHASPTPVVDDERVYVFFGMHGVACLDLASGKVLWKNTELKHDHDKNGPGSSPILHGDLLVLTCDGTEVQFLCALDKRTGKLRWKADRSNRAELAAKNFHLRKAYHTPEIIRVNGRDQLISMGAFRVCGYDPDNGRELWFVDLPGFSNVPRPVFGHGLLFIATGFMKPELWAIRPGGTGNLTRSNVAWKYAKQAPQKPSPILVGDQLFVLSDAGILTCLDAKSGRELWAERLGGEFSASPVFADGHLFFCNQAGVTTVLKPGANFEVVARNTLAGGFMASPAVAGKALYLRTKTHLYRIEK